MQKKVLSEQSIYFGKIKMPKDWEIDQNDLAHHILHSNLTSKDLQFSPTLDKLNTYVKEFIKLKYSIALVNKKEWGNIYKPKETTPPLLKVDPLDLQNSPDFTLLYGVKTKNCVVKIHYDDNRRKGMSWNLELEDNMFIMFPSTNMYYLTNNQKDSLNFVQTITYEYI